MKIPTFARLVGAATLAACFGLAPLAASAYSNVVIFGDSLSDSGNDALKIGTRPGQVITGNTYVPTFPYGSGTYSNGDVWATSFAAALGLQALPSLAGGTDYAYGGAETRGVIPPSLQKQVSMYLGTAPTDAANTLFVIAGGGNNALAAMDAIQAGAPVASTVLSTARQYANDIGKMVDALQAAGATHIVVWDTPDIGLTPLEQAGGASNAALGSFLAGAMNSALAKRLAGETGVLGFDVYGLMDQAVAKPSAYGFSNVSDACGAVTGCDPSQYLFWDGIHPTSAGHQLISQAMVAAVGALVPVPEPGSLWLFAMGLGAVMLRRRIS